jgi:tellurite methyltransferase
MGFRVDALDISEVALKRLCETAREARVDIACVATDLDLPEPTIPAGPYSLIVLVRYVNLAAYPLLIECLKPGGYLVTEQHLQTSKRVIGPRSPEFRLAPGALQNACATLDCLHAFEGLVTDPDGRLVALAQFVGRKRDPVFDTRVAKTA